MINFILTLPVFLFAWVTVFLLHELCHLLEAYRQNKQGGKINVFIRNGVPTFTASPDDKLKNCKLFNLAGGLYSGTISLLIGLIAVYCHAVPFYISFVTLGVLNIVYSVFEYSFLGEISMEQYYRYHYFVYGIVLAIMAFIWRLLGVE